MSRLVSLIFLLNVLVFANEEFLDSDFNATVTKRSMFKVAILPFYNQTPYPNIAYYMRKECKEQLQFKGYDVISFKVVDRKLKEMGLQKAEHLKYLKFNRLAKELNADALMFGIVENANVKDAGVYNGYLFGGSLKLQLKGGKVVWYSLSKRVAKRRWAVDPVNLVFNFLSNRDEDLSKDAIKAVAQRLLKSIPSTSKSVEIDDLLQKAVMIESKEKR